MIPLSIKLIPGEVLKSHEEKGHTIQQAVKKVEVGVLSEKTVSGMPVVGLLAELPNGDVVLIKTTLRLFLSAADALKAAHGDPRK